MSWTLLGDHTKSSLLSALATIFLGPLIYLIVGPNSFYKKPPCHNMLCIEAFIGEIFVVSIHHYLLSQGHAAKSWESVILVEKIEMLIFFPFMWMRTPSFWVPKNPLLLIS